MKKNFFYFLFLFQIFCKSPKPLIPNEFFEEKDIFFMEEKRTLDFYEEKEGFFDEFDFIEYIIEEFFDAGDAKVINPPLRNCDIKLTYDGKGKNITNISVPGEFNGWDPKAYQMQDNDKDGIWEVIIKDGEIQPGEYGYKFLINGKDWVMDEKNPYIKYVNDIENSKLIVEDCSLPAFKIEETFIDNKNRTVKIVVQLFNGKAAEGIKTEKISATLNREPLSMEFFDKGGAKFIISLKNLQNGKYTFRFNAENNNGKAKELFIPVWIEDEEFLWTDAILYFAMTDRFLDGNSLNSKKSSCLPPDSPSQWMGGDFAGLGKKIEDGYFSTLGINTIWISAVNNGPDGCYKGDLGKYYTAYHGYWPASLYEVEEHFGNLKEVQEFIASAHKKGIKVMMDLVTNHIHEENELYALHKKDGWFHEYYQCGFDEKPIECWFQPYLPDINFKNNDALNAIIDSAIYWIKTLDLDAFRVDAVKHMVHNFSWTLRAKIKEEIENGNLPFYLVGETYVGEWGGGGGKNEKTIKEYVSQKELNGQFDFPLYWEIIKTFARGEGSFIKLSSVIEESKDYYGKEAIMGIFLGNHDVPRFITHADGKIKDQWGTGAKELGWDNPPQQPTNEEVYKRLELAFMLLMTLKGIPLIYYGDEIAMAGAGDPDNRRVMKFENINFYQTEVKEFVSKLTKIRKENKALRRGSFKNLNVKVDFYSFARFIDNDFAIVAINLSKTAKKESINLKGVSGISDSMKLKDLLSEKIFDIKNFSFEITLEEMKGAILVKF